MNKIKHLYTNNKKEFREFLKSRKNQRKNDELQQLILRSITIKIIKISLFQETVDDDIYTPQKTHLTKRKKNFDILNKPINQKEVEEGIRDLKSKSHLDLIVLLTRC